MGLFGKNKEKEEKKILEEMKRKKQQIEKLKEEMNNMAKLVLKDGKLQKVEDKKDEAMIIPPSPPPSKPMYDTPDNSMQEAQQAMREQIYRKQMQEQMIQERINEEVRQRQLQEQQQRYAQSQAQPRYAQAAPVANIKVIIEMINGATYGIELPETQISAFLTELDTAINGQTTFPLSNRVINGKNIISYVVE